MTCLGLSWCPTVNQSSGQSDLATLDPDLGQAGNKDARCGPYVARTIPKQAAHLTFLTFERCGIKTNISLSFSSQKTIVSVSR